MRCACCDRQCRGCPRNCKRRADDHKYHWGSIDPGKVVEGDDPRARKPAASHGHARARRAGCPEAPREPGWSAAQGRRQIVPANVLTVWTFAVEHRHVYLAKSLNFAGRRTLAPARPKRSVQGNAGCPGSALPLGLVILLSAGSARACIGANWHEAGQCPGSARAGCDFTSQATDSTRRTPARKTLQSVPKRAERTAAKPSPHSPATRRPHRRAVHDGHTNAAQHQCRGDQRQSARPDRPRYARHPLKSSPSSRCRSRATAPPRKPRQARSACCPATCGGAPGDIFHARLHL